MVDPQILQKLSEIPTAKWEKVFKKCYGHVNIRLKGRTATGAHSEQRLGAKAHEYYLSNALTALYEGRWTWDFEKYSIEDQLARIINSMISSEVEKYKVEIKRGQKTFMMEQEQLSLLLEEDTSEEFDEAYFKKMSRAIAIACENDERYKRFLHLKYKGFNYKQIAKEMNCTANDVYQMMETISRRAKKIAKLL